MSSVISVSFVRNVRSSCFVAVHGRLPIHIPNSERDSGASRALRSSSDACSRFATTRSTFTCGSVMVGAALPCFAFRSAFLDGGSGAATSTSISTVGLWSRFRFLDGDCGGLSVVTVIAVEWRPIADYDSTRTLKFSMGLRAQANIPRTERESPCTHGPHLAYARLLARAGPQICM